MTDSWTTTPSARKPPVLKTWMQPFRLVGARWREGGNTLAELECGHVEPANGKDLWHSIRCEQCNPVPRLKPPPLPFLAPIDLDMEP